MIPTLSNVSIICIAMTYSWKAVNIEMGDDEWRVLWIIMNDRNNLMDL